MITAAGLLQLERNDPVAYMAHMLASQRAPGAPVADVDEWGGSSRDNAPTIDGNDLMQTAADDALEASEGTPGYSNATLNTGAIVAAVIVLFYFTQKK